MNLCHAQLPAYYLNFAHCFARKQSLFAKAAQTLPLDSQNGCIKQGKLEPENRRIYFLPAKFRLIDNVNKLYPADCQCFGII